jgi:hypothetical protein
LINKRLNKILKTAGIFLIIQAIFFSGSTLLALSSLILDKHECCCCKEDGEPQESSYLKCNKDCCTITETKVNSIEGSNQVQLRNVIGILNFEVKPDNVVECINSFIVSAPKFFPQKIFLIISILRI